MRRTRGIALIVILILTSLLSMMMVAFVRTQHANFSLSRRSDASLRATQACLSGLDYARNRLQHSRDWGTSGLGSRTQVVDQPGLRISEGGVDSAHNLVEGESDGDTFQVHWVNNLNGTASLTAPNFSRRQLEIPEKATLVVVEGTSGGHHRHLEALLRNDFFTTVPFSSGSDLGMSASQEPGSQVNFTNPNPELNRVKSRGKTSMPDASLLHFGPNPGAGSIAGKEDVLLGADLRLDSSGQMVSSNGTSMAAATQSARQAAETQIHASIQPARDQRAPALSGDQLRKPTGADSKLPAGRYIFTAPGEVAFYSNPAANPASDPPDHLYTGAIYNNGSQMGVQGSEAVVLKDFQFVPRGQVQSDGDVSVESAKRWLTPQLSLGYDADGAMTKGMSSWQVNGNFTIQGNVAGNGALITKGTGSIDIQGKTQLSQSPDASVALYSENAIQIRPVSDNLRARSDIFDKNDFHFLSMAFDVPEPSSTAIGVGKPFDRGQWFGAGEPDQRYKVGTDDTINFPEGLGPSSPVLRDQGIPVQEYVDKILPNLAGYKDGMTPLGLRPLSQTEKDAVTQFIQTCATEGVRNPGISVGRHIRIKEFLRSCDSKAQGDPAWFDYRTRQANGTYGQKTRLVQDILRNFAQSMFEEARRTNKDKINQVVSEIYQNWGDKDLPDVSLRGIAYANKSFLSSTTRSFKLRGGVATNKGFLYLQNLHRGEFYFDPDTLENLMELTKIPLIPVNWAIE